MTAIVVNNEIVYLVNQEEAQEVLLNLYNLVRFSLDEDEIYEKYYDGHTARVNNWTADIGSNVFDFRDSDDQPYITRRRCVDA